MVSASVVWPGVGGGTMSLINANKAKGMLFYGLKVCRNDWAITFSDEDDSSPQGIIDEMWIWDDQREMCMEEKAMKKQ